MAPPPLTHRCTVEPGWIDYNGHMNEAYYVLAFSRASDVLLDAIGMTAAHRAATGTSMYILENHVRYRREVGAGACLQIGLRVLGVDAKRVHFCQTMTADGIERATVESLFIHVDQGTGRSSPMPDAVRAVARDLARAAGPWPDWVGHTIRPLAE